MYLFVYALRMLATVVHEDVLHIFTYTAQTTRPADLSERAESGKKNEAAPGWFADDKQLRNFFANVLFFFEKPQFLIHAT